MIRTEGPGTGRNSRGLWYRACARARAMAHHPARRIPPMAHMTQTDVTRRQMLKVSASAAAAAGYAISVETVLAQAVKTDTKGIVAGYQGDQVGRDNMRSEEHTS